MRKKSIHHDCEDGIEKSVPRDRRCHHSTSLVMPMGDPQDGFFYPTLKLMMDAYIIAPIVCWCLEFGTCFMQCLVSFLVWQAS